MRKNFTLVELIVVIAIVALLASLTIPNLLRARLNANEGAAKSTLNTLATQAVTFSAQNGSYPASLAVMSAASPQYIDSSFDDSGGSPQRQGYVFTYANTDASGNIHGFWIRAIPATANVSGTRYFYVDESIVICEGANPAGGHALLNEACPAGFIPLR